MSFALVFLIFIAFLVLLYYSKRIVTRLTVVKEWNEKENPHGDLEQILPGIYRVQSTYHNRIWNMYIYPLLRGGLLIINPMIVRKDVLDKILALGEPSVLIALSDTICPVHTKDVFAWRKKFPQSIFVCPNSAYYRLVHDIPLVYLRDITVEIQLHYDDVEVVFPREDRKEMHLLLRVKDQYSNDLHPNEALVMGEMFVGPNTPDGKVEESSINKALSTLARNRTWTTNYLYKTLDEHVIAGILPAHGLAVTDESICTGSPSTTTSSSSTSTAAPEERKAQSTAQSALAEIAHNFGPAEVEDKKKD